MRAVKRVDISAAVRSARPAGRLDRAARLERQLVVILLRLRRLDSALAGQPRQIAESAHHVEAVIVDASVGDVAFHPLPGSLAPALEEPGLARGVKLQQRRPVLKAARPVGPLPGLVTAFRRHYGRTGSGIPRLLNGADFYTGKFKQPLNAWTKLLRREFKIDLDHLRLQPLQAAEVEPSVHVNHFSGGERKRALRDSRNRAAHV